MGSLNFKILVVHIFVNLISAEVGNLAVEENETAVWHSYIFNTGAGNREDLHISDIQLEHLNISLTKDISNWAGLKVYEKTFIVGFQDSSLLLINYVNNTAYNSYETELSGKASDVTLFQSWNATSLEVEGYAVVAVEYKNETWLNWYRITENGMLYLWDWPVHRKITYLKVVRLNEELKLLMLNQGIFDSSNPVAEMYGFLMQENFDLWLISRTLFSETPTSVSVCHDGDFVYLSVSLPKTGLVQVFKHSILAPSEKYFTFHQEIASEGIISLTSFRISFRWYLGITGTMTKIYRFNGNSELIPVRQFDVGFSDYLQVIPVNSYRQEVIILAKKKSNVVVISGAGEGEFKVHGNLSSLICSKDSECLEKMNQVALQGSASFFKDNHQMIFCSHSNQPMILKFSVRLQPLTDVVTSELNEVLAEKERLDELFLRQLIEIEKLRNLTKSLLNKNGEVEIRNKWIVKNLTTVKTEYETLDNVNIKDVEFGGNKNWSIKDFSVDIDNLKSEIDFLKLKMKEVKLNLIANELESNELSTIDLPELINGGIIASGPVYVDELEVEEMNEEKVNDFLNDLYRLDQPKKIYGTKTISNLVADDVFFEKLNNISTTDILYADDVYEDNEGNVINGDLIYENDLFVIGNVTLFPGGSVNNLSLETDVVRPNVMFSRSTVKFENVKVEEETNIRNINKRPLILPIHNPPFDIHTLDSVNQARIEQVNVKNDLNVSFMNTRNFTELMEKLIYENDESEKNFSTLNLNGTFSTSHLDIEYLNGLKYPEDFILSTEEGPIEVFGEKELLGDLIVDNVNIGSNDIETMSSPRIFEKNSFGGNAHGDSENLVTDEVLFVDTINNHPWDYFESIVRKDEKKPVITGLKRYTKSLEVNDFKLYGKLNDKNLDDLLTKDTDQVINSTQIFRAAVFKNLTLGSTYDGVCVKCLNESIVRISRDGMYESSLIFNDSVCNATKFNVLETLNYGSDRQGVKFENGSLILNGNTNFSKIKTKNFKVDGSVNTFDKINNVNLTDLEQRRLSLSRPQVIDHDFSFDNLTIRGNISVLVVNGKNILAVDEPKSDRKNSINKIFDGDKTFTTVTVKGKIETNNVNNFNLTDLKENAVNIKKGDTLPGLTIFKDSVYFKELNLTGRLDGFYLRKLKRDVVKKNSPVFLRGKKIFANGLNVTKSLRIRTLNGHLIQDIATVQGDHIMNNTVIVNGNVIVRKNLTLHGSINNLAVHDLQRKFSTEFNSFIIPGDATFKGRNNTVRKLTVRGRINNVDFDSFMESVIWKDQDFNVGGKKTFLNEVWFDGNLIVEKNINKLRFTEFSKDVVMKNKPAKISGGIVLWRAIVKNLNVTHDLNTTLLNGKDTNEWVDESIPLHEDIFVSGKKSFTHVSSSKKISADFINDHPPETMIPLESDQYIPDFVQFSKISVRSNVPVEGKVNGKNLKEEWENTVMVSGDQIISGKVTFENNLIVDGDAFIPSANGILLENLTTLHTDQVIKTVLSFEGPVVVKNNIEKLKIVNGIDLEEWDKNAVLLNREQTVDGIWNILGNVTALKNIEGDALLNNISIPILAKQVEKTKLLNSQTENELELEYQLQCEALKNLSGELVHQPYLFRQFDLVQVLDSYFISSRAQFDLVIESVITFEANNNHYLILTFVDECFGELNRWDRSSSTYVYLKQVKLGSVHKWLAINYNDTTYLVTTSVNDAVLCDDDLKGGNVWSFEDEEKYGHLFTTEAFSDIIQSKNESNVFYTLRENGFVHEWRLKEKSPPEFKFFQNIGKGNYKFVDLEGLAVANSRGVQKIDFPSSEVSIGSKIQTFFDGEIASLTVKGKIFTAVANKDQVVIYDILQGNVVTSIYSRKPKSLLWFDFGSGKEIFLIFQSRGRILEIFEYKGVAGFKRKMSLHIPLKNLQSVTLPDKNNYESHKYLIVVQRKKMYLLKARMLGHLYVENNVDC